MKLKASEKRLWCLENVNILRLLPEEERQQLQKHCKINSYKIGEQFGFSGTPGQTLYFLSRGRARLSDGKMLETGELFGENPVTDPVAEKLLGESIGPVTLCSIDSDELESFAETCPWLTLKITKREGFHFTTVEHRLEWMFFKNISKRLAHLLLILRRSHGTPVEKGVQLRLSLTAQDLARLLGASAESVSSLLSDFTEAGLIEEFNRHIVIKDIAGLHKREAH